jgi:hypothetical protein
MVGYSMLHEGNKRTLNDNIVSVSMFSETIERISIKFGIEILQ